MTATRRSLRNSASTTSLPPRLPSADYRSSSSTTTAHSSSRTASHSKQEPSLAELIRAEQDWDASTRPHSIEAATRTDVTIAATKPHARRRSSAPLPDLPPTATERQEVGTQILETSPPPFALDHVPPVPPLLLPPHYGKPIRPSSPDAFAALFRPVLRSLSRPASPPASRTPSSLNLRHQGTTTTTTTSALTRKEKSGTESATITSAPIDRSSSSLPAQFPPREPTDPAPTVESQGFVLYIGSLVAYVMYLVWAFLPEKWLVAIGIEWYPSRDWALLVPAWIVMLVAFVYISYFLLTMYSTPSLALPEPYDDPRAYIPPPPRPELGKDGRTRGPTPLWAHAVLLPEEAIPPLYDLPIKVVERVLYGSSDEDGDVEGGEGGTDGDQEAEESVR